MMIKCMGGSGSGQSAEDYLLKKLDHLGRPRFGIEILRGDVKLNTALIDSIDFKNKYTSVVIAFHPDDKVEDFDIDKVIDSFEEYAFAGLKKEQYTFYAVKHLEENEAGHVHIIIPRVELTTGKSLNIAPPGHEYYFDKWRDFWNKSKGWRSPADPEVARGLNPNELPLPSWRDQSTKKTNRNDISAEVAEFIKSGAFADRETLIGYLNQFGEVTRAGDDYISYKASGFDKAIRLKGPLFARDADYTKCSESVPKKPTPDLAAAEKFKAKLDVLVKKRQDYNQRRFPIIKELDYDIDQEHGYSANDFGKYKDIRESVVSEELEFEGTDAVEQFIEESKFEVNAAIGVGRYFDERIAEVTAQFRRDKSTIAENERRVEEYKLEIAASERSIAESTEYAAQTDKWFQRIGRVIKIGVGDLIKKVATMISAPIRKDEQIIINARKEREDRERRDEEKKMCEKDEKRLFIRKLIEDHQDYVDLKKAIDLTKEMINDLNIISENAHEAFVKMVVVNLYMQEYESFYKYFGQDAKQIDAAWCGQDFNRAIELADDVLEKIQRGLQPQQPGDKVVIENDVDKKPSDDYGFDIR